MACSLNDLIDSQDRLVQEAALALPHEFSRCTYNLGPIRQAVYLCLTCKVPRGICASCSIACHTDHEQVELFPKRKFRCDCPTSAIPHHCTLHKTAEEENATNKYGQNYLGIFCRCSRPYDPKTERETMIQCLACEDWFHESCLNLRDPPHSEADSDPGPADTQSNDGSDLSSDSLSPPLVTAEDYDVLVCHACVAKIDILRRYAGTRGVIMVIRDDENSPWKKHDEDCPSTPCRSCNADDPPVQVNNTELSLSARHDSCSESEEREAKRRKISDTLSSTCLAPPVNLIAKAIFECQSQNSNMVLSIRGAGDIFLTDGWRRRWCRCDQCLPSLQEHPYLLEEEETYEPPEDPDSGLSLEELGLRALNRMPRDRAIDGIRAFNDMRDELMEYLRPFAQEGKVVEAADVNRFFETLMGDRHARN